MKKPRFPDAHVELSGHDGNAGAIMGSTVRALKGAGATPEEIREYRLACMSGDYDALIRTTMAWVETE